MAPAGIDGGDEAVHKGSRPKSSSQVTLCWRELDSNPRSPVTRHPNLDVRQRAAVFFAFSRGRFSGVA
jgi:hypothetical protein